MSPSHSVTGQTPNFWRCRPPYRLGSSPNSRLPPLYTPFRFPLFRFGFHPPASKYEAGFQPTQVPPTAPPSLSNELETLKNETTDHRGTHCIHRSQNRTRDHRQDFGSPRIQFGPPNPAIVLSRHQVMGRTMPTAPLPHHPLHSEGYEKMARDVPRTRRKSRPPRQSSTRRA